MDLRHALKQFSAECEGAGMKVCTSMSEAMVLSWKSQVLTSGEGRDLAPGRGVYYLGIFFMSDGVSGGG